MPHRLYTIDYIKRILLDADALIKITRSGAKELVTAAFQAFIPSAVEREVVQEGTRLGFPDAAVVQDNLAQGRLTIAPDQAEHGDEALLQHALAGGFAAVVTDDAYLLTRLKARGVSATVPAAMLLATGRRLQLGASQVMALLDALAPYISDEQYVTYRLILESRYPKR